MPYMSFPRHRGVEVTRAWIADGHIVAEIRRPDPEFPNSPVSHLLDFYRFDPASGRFVISPENNTLISSDDTDLTAIPLTSLLSHCRAAKREAA